ncbi:MAG: cytochrome c peroxidase [Chthoniobacterales bacterium]
MRARFGFILALLVTSALAQVPSANFTNFEARQTTPLRLTPDGKWLLAVNSADARLSVFNTTTTPPLLAKEIPVGIEPVSVNAHTNDEVWVVNELSDSISVVSLSQGIVTDTINVKDEPSDVVFAGGNAFVSVAGNNEVRVFDATTHGLTKTIPLTGQRPRAMAVNADGSKVFVVFAESGNRTTLIPANLAPPQPSPTNSALPAPPQVGLIVDATDPQWNPSVIKYVMPDNDVAEIDVAALTVSRYFSRVGTHLHGIAVQPGTGDLFVTNTDARNLVHFEPNLRAHFIDNRVTRIPIGGGAFSISDLNPGIDYNLLPNPAAQAAALAQPTAIVFDPSGAFSYIAAFGSDRVAKVAADGSVISRIEIGTGVTDSRHKRGPRGLAINSATNQLYVLNRISNTITVIDSLTSRIVSEVPLGGFDPTPQVIRDGRGFLYDARLSGNGTVSCASCHLDGNNDRLAWDLGDPGGQMQSVTATVSALHVTGTFDMHPMKGPMTTQTLKGLKNQTPLHWRGDRADVTSFNPAFVSLLGGSQLSTADINAFRDFVETMNLPPNPNQQLDRSLPGSIAGGDPNAGRNTFLNENYNATLRCNSCHLAPPGSGSDRSLTPAAALQESQSFKVPQLRNAYQKTSFTDTPGAISLDGFGFTHDGTDPTLFRFLSRPVFVNFRNDTTRKNNLNAFVMCFDTGMAPAVGFTRTVTSASATNPSLTSDWNTLQSQAAAGNIDLIVKGTIDGKRRGLLYQPATNNYKSDKTGVGPFTQAQLQTKVSLGDMLSVTGVPPGSGVRMAIDRDLDGTLDGDGPPFASYSEWQSYWFTAAEVADAAISGPQVDPDHDGRSNLLEYALNTNPKQPDKAGPGLTSSRSNGSFALIFTRNMLATDVEYLVEDSADLTNWVPSTATLETLADDGQMQTIRATTPVTAASVKFLRLVVTQHAASEPARSRRR